MTSAESGSNGNPVVRSVHKLGEVIIWYHSRRHSWSTTNQLWASANTPTLPKTNCIVQKPSSQTSPTFPSPSSTTKTTTTTKHNHRHLKKERSCKHIKQPNTLWPSQKMQLLLLVQLLSCYSLSIWSCSS